MADDSPAAKAGIEVGDVIKSIGGKTISDAEIAAAVKRTLAHKAGDKVKVKTRTREGKEKEVEANLRRPAGSVKREAAAAERWRRTAWWRRGRAAVRTRH